MRLSIDFPTRLNASCKTINVVIRQRLSEKQGVFLGVPWNTSALAPPLFPTPLTILNITHFSASHLSHFTAHFCTSWCVLTMTNVYPRLSNCQPHHTVHISVVVSTTVLTITTAHNMAISSIPVLIALHFLCTAIVCAHVPLTLVHITIDK
jgi:hypothetical protein